ncbi:MAG: hypothetical protein AB1916_08170 [Thermodesulfobacteriota bacterium]
MLVDPVTAAAQVVNFLILAWLLWRFLYRPILRAAREREAKIAERLRAADQAREDAAREKAAARKAHQALLQAREQLLAEAAEEVSRWRDEALERAGREVEERHAVWEEGLAAERQALERSLRAALADTVLAVSRKVLADLADENLERRLAEVFLARAEAEGPKLLGSNGAAGPLTVHSGLPLQPEIRERLAGRLAGLFPRAGGISFAEQPGLGFGLRLTAGDRKVEWSLAAYLDALEQEMLGAALPAGRERAAQPPSPGGSGGEQA